MMGHSAPQRPLSGLSLAGPFAGPVVAGNPYDNCFKIPAYSTLTAAANQVRMGRFAVARNLTIDRIGVELTALGTTGTDAYYVGIYGVDANGGPGKLLFLSDAITGLTAGNLNEFRYATLATPFTFRAGLDYYLAVHTGGNAQLRSVAANGAVMLALPAGGGTSGQLFTVFGSSAPIGTPLTDWTFAASQLSTGLPFRVLMRAAA